MCERSTNVEASEEARFLITVLHVTLHTWRQGGGVKVALNRGMGNESHVCDR